MQSFEQFKTQMVAYSGVIIANYRDIPLLSQFCSFLRTLNGAIKVLENLLGRKVQKRVWRKEVKQ